MVDCVECEFEAVRNSKLVKNVMQMILHSRLANEKLLTDFLVTEALGQELDNLLLAFTEKMFFAARLDFRRLGKSLHHFRGHAVIQPDFSGMNVLNTFHEKVSSGLFQDDAACPQAHSTHNIAVVLCRSQDHNASRQRIEIYLFKYSKPALIGHA